MQVTAAPAIDISPESRAFARLRHSLSAWVTLGEPEWARLRLVFRFKRAAAGQDIRRPGSGADGAVFVASGLVRSYYAEGSGFETVEANKGFLTQGQFSPPREGCLMGPEGHCGLQALEDSDLLLADHAAWKALYDAHPVFDRIGRKLGEWWMGRKEAHGRSFQTLDGRGRYLAFLREHAELSQRVPQYHLANYLGVTDVSLSRIRRALAERPERAANEKRRSVEPARANA